MSDDRDYADIAEEEAPVNDAAERLVDISQAVQRGSRLVLTLEGKPQAVLMGYQEYQGMKAAIDFLQDPALMERVGIGLAQVEEDRARRYAVDEGSAFAY